MSEIKTWICQKEPRMTEKDGKTLQVHGIGDIVKISVLKDLYN